MSRIGIRPIKIDEGVSAEITSAKAVFTCGQNKLEVVIPSKIEVKNEDGNIFVTRKENSKEARSLHGLIARLIKNAITGVKDGFIKELNFVGTGYRAAVNGEEIALNMGYSHEIKFVIPDGIKVEVKKNNIIVSGTDKSAVGAFAAIIREVRPPEVYKGKGIKYKDEHIKRKAGKKASA